MGEIALTEPIASGHPPGSTIVDRAIEAISSALAWCFALAVAATIYDVVCDVVFRAPTIWVYDLVTTAIAVAFLIGGSLALRRREHIRITVIYDRFPRRVQLVCDVVTSILAIVYLVSFAWFSWNMAAISVRNWELGGSVWAQPTPVVVKLAMLTGAGLMIVQMISNILGDVRALKRLP